MSNKGHAFDGEHIEVYEDVSDDTVNIVLDSDVFRIVGDTGYIVIEINRDEKAAKRIMKAFEMLDEITDEY